MNLGDFRKLTAELSDDVELMYPSLDHGCTLTNYKPEGVWVHRDPGPLGMDAIVLQPGDDYDGRRPK